MSPQNLCYSLRFMPCINHTAETMQHLTVVCPYLSFVLASFHTEGKGNPQRHNGTAQNPNRCTMFPLPVPGSQHTTAPTPELR